MGFDPQIVNEISAHSDATTTIIINAKECSSATVLRNYIDILLKETRNNLTFNSSNNVLLVLGNKPAQQLFAANEEEDFPFLTEKMSPFLQK